MAVPNIEIAPETQLGKLDPQLKTDLVTLRNSIVSIATTPEGQKAGEDLNKAIASDNRTEVSNALKQLSTRTEFDQLRLQIDKTQYDVAEWHEKGTQLAETTVADAYKTLPGWARVPLLGTAASGVIFLASRFIKYGGKLISWGKWKKPEELSKKMDDFAGLLITGSFFAGLGKGALDVWNGGLRTIVPEWKWLKGPPDDAINQRITSTLSTTHTIPGLDSNGQVTISVPPLAPSTFPMLNLTAIALDASGKTIGPVALPAAVSGGVISVPSGTDQIEYQYVLTTDPAGAAVRTCRYSLTKYNTPSIAI